MQKIVNHTAAIRQLPTVNFVLYDVGPVQQALAEMEIQSDGVPEPGD